MTWQQRWTGAMMDNYGTPPLMLTRGKGSRVWDEDGNEYVDLIAGIAVNALGHGDPRITEAITDQLNTLGHVSNLYASEPGIELAEKLIVAEGSFHGRTMGSLALTAQPGKADPFRPLPGDVVTVPYGDTRALEAAIDADTAAVFLEPIQGEGGVVVPPPGYLQAARRATTAVGAMLVIDE